MLACAGVDRQHEYEPSWAPGPVGHRGGCDRELYADADGRVYTCQPAVSRVISRRRPRSSLRRNRARALAVSHSASNNPREMRAARILTAVSALALFRRLEHVSAFHPGCVKTCCSM